MRPDAPITTAPPPARGAAGPSGEAAAVLLRSLAAVPRGRLTTYGALARLAGRPRSARWVGRVLATLPTDSTLPWHRVVNAAGRISLPAGSPAAAEQARRLSREGIEVSDAGRVPLARLRWP